MQKILVAIATCNKPEFFLRAQSQERTWVRFARRTGQPIDITFCAGHRDAAGDIPFHEDYRYFDVDDSYAALPEKVRAIYRWALECGYDYVFKTDDDTFINVEALLETPRGVYVGNVRGATGGYPAPYPSGFGYWLSKRAMEIVAKAELTIDPNEDRWVGNTLAAAGIRPLHDGYHYRVIYPNGIENPEKIWAADSRIGHAAVFAQLPPEKMFATEKAFERYYPYYRRYHRKPRVVLEDACARYLPS